MSVLSLNLPWGEEQAGIKKAVEKVFQQPF